MINFKNFAQKIFQIRGKIFAEKGSVISLAQRFGTNSVAEKSQNPNSDSSTAKSDKFAKSAKILKLGEKSQKSIFAKNLSRENGFTLIELSMALLFIAFIMVFLIATLMSVLRTYNKGVWLSQINQAGRQINSDIGDRARFAGAAVKPGDANVNRLCVGGVAYIWNINGGATEKFSDNTPISLVRVVQQGATNYCAKSGSTYPRPSRTAAETTVLLGAGVLIKKFDVKPIEGKNLLTVDAVFSTSGSNQPTENPARSGNWTCLDSAGDNQYCAFMQLKLTVFGRGEW